MSTALVSAFYDVGDVLCQNQRNSTNYGSSPTQQRKIVGSPIMNFNSRPRSNSAFMPTVSGKISPTATQLISLSDSPLPGLNRQRLDRTLSEPGDRNQRQLQQQQQQPQQQQQAQNSTRYKTELCRPFEESGHCKYGDKCQFAHGAHELRSLSRHPKYKTELCRTFHTIGFCPYGPRCHFIHNDDEGKLNHINSTRQQQQTQVPIKPRPLHFSLPLGSTADSPPSSISGDSPSLSPSFLNDDVFSMFSPLNVAPISAPVASSNNFLYPDLPPSPTFQQQLMMLNQTNNNFDHVEEIFCPPSPPFEDNTCSSPLDVSRGLRLPVFSRLSLDD